MPPPATLLSPPSRPSFAASALSPALADPGPENTYRNAPPDAAYLYNHKHSGANHGAIDAAAAQQVMRREERPPEAPNQRARLCPCPSAVPLLPAPPHHSLLEERNRLTSGALTRWRRPPFSAQATARLIACVWLGEAAALGFVTRGEIAERAATFAATSLRLAAGDGSQHGASDRAVDFAALLPHVGRVILALADAPPVADGTDADAAPASRLAIDLALQARCHLPAT